MAGGHLLGCSFRAPPQGGVSYLDTCTLQDTDHLLGGLSPFITPSLEGTPMLLSPRGCAQFVGGVIGVFFVHPVLYENRKLVVGVTYQEARFGPLWGGVSYLTQVCFRTWITYLEGLDWCFF